MISATKTALAELRAYLGLKRLSPRRLFVIDDGAYCWVGDRAELTAADARALRAIHQVGSRPDLADAATKAAADAADYDGICNRVGALACTDSSSGRVNWDDLPEDWRDGSALGPIRPL